MYVYWLSVIALVWEPGWDVYTGVIARGGKEGT